MKRTLLNALICAGATVALGVGSVRADTIYLSTNYNGNAFTMANGQEVGNQITVTPGYTLTGFSIEYDAPGSLATDVGVDVRFYQNDGPLNNGYATPDSIFYDSGWFYNDPQESILDNGYWSVTSGPMDLTFPTNNFTVSITWTNLDGSSQIDMPLANNTAGPGANTGEYWLNTDGSWELLTNSVPANFIAEFDGTVPEPSTFGLAGIGGALLLGINKLRRKS